MSDVKVEAGACGFTSMIHVTKIDRKTVEVTINSPCVMIQSFNKALGTLPWMKVFAKIKDSEIFQAAQDNISHTDCPVPVAVLKAIMVEMGAALPKNASIVFQTGPEETEASLLSQDN